MPLKETVVDAGARGMNMAHRAILKVSQGRFLATPFGMPGIELTVTGRTSGLPRKTMLTAPIMDPERVVLVASKGGDDRDPQWFRNLVSNPDVEIRVVATGEVRRLRARVADPGEKAALWPSIVAAYKGYAGYQRRTQREIPVVICEPAGP